MINGQLMILTWNEKTLIKDIKLEDGCVIRFKLHYTAEYETKTNEYGCKWNVKTGNKIPMMRIEKLIPGSTEGIYITHTIQDNKPMGDPEKTLKFTTLCRISGEINKEEELKAITA